MGIFDIFKSKTKNENEKDYAREIANIIGCDYAEISGRVILNGNTKISGTSQIKSEI